MREPPRDPSQYRLSVHAFQRRKNRGIDKAAIASCIQNGIAQEAKGGYPSVKFVHVPLGVDEAVAVIANAEDGAIKTVYWDVECCHPKIVELREKHGLMNSTGVTS